MITLMIMITIMITDHQFGLVVVQARRAGWRTPLGRLAPQFGADVAVFVHDLTELEPERWGEVRARAVWVAGKPEPIRN